jgi:hypothetical protein
MSAESTIAPANGAAQNAPAPAVDASSVTPKSTTDSQASDAKVSAPPGAAVAAPPAPTVSAPSSDSAAAPRAEGSTTPPATEQQNREAALARLEAAAARLETAAAAFKKDDSVWDSIFVNVLSNRIDEFLFGKGNEHRGAVAVGAAWLTLAVSLLKLLIAYFSWRKLHSRVQRGWRVVDMTLALFLTVAAAMGVWVLMAAKSEADVVAQQLTANNKALDACAVELQALRAQRPGVEKPQQTQISNQLLESFNALAKTCTAQQQALVNQVNALKNTTDSVAKSQWGSFFQFIVFLAACGVFALVILALNSRNAR